MALMDLVTLAATCGFAARATLFVPLHQPPTCVSLHAAVSTNSSDVIAAWQPYIAEASRRFGVPEAWIAAVMQAESGGHATMGGQPIRSSAGAIGLMQVMPATYAELRARYGLGADPYAQRDNILAGTAYLREMLDRYGAPEFLAAYNAGPARLDESLLTGRALPVETRRYLAGLAPQIGAPPGDAARASGGAVPDAGSGAVGMSVANGTVDRSPTPAARQDGTAGGLFVTATGQSADRLAANLPLITTLVPAAPAAPDRAQNRARIDRSRVSGRDALTGDERSLFVVLQ